MIKAINKPQGPLPPDPEGQNDDRAEWAEVGLQAFQNRTRTDSEDALSDLLCDLRHWSDRRGLDWYAELARAMRNYADETNGEFEFQTNEPRPHNRANRKSHARHQTPPKLQDPPHHSRRARQPERG